jgi:hypothetical protein
MTDNLDCRKRQNMIGAVVFRLLLFKYWTGEGGDLTWALLSVSILCIYGAGQRMIIGQ